MVSGDKIIGSFFPLGRRFYRNNGSGITPPPTHNPLQSKKTWCLTSTETIKLIIDEEKGGQGRGGGGRVGGGGEGDYSPIATRLSPPE